ncbi:MAG: cation-translocating P-type ATPase [Planctomycetes bacterium]|nr:cation-translocating P-type ATPase [Planctomycetota bacterium]
MRTLPPRIQNLTNKVSAVFVPLTVLLALSAFAWVLVIDNDLPAAIFRGLTVALIACPCALGLAAPLATWMTAHRLASRGIIIRSGDALENGGTVRHLYLDKTGTLTSGRFKIESVTTIDETLENPLALAAGLEQASTHPIGDAIRAAADEATTFDEIEPVPGLGVRGSLAGDTYALGRPDFPGQQPLPADTMTPNSRDKTHTIVLWRNEQPVALFGLVEEERPDTEAALNTLRRLGLNLHVLTGDASTQAAAFAQRYHLPVSTALMPDDKRQIIVDRRRETHKPIGFVGDGINDAPALSEADLGIAVHTGSDLAQASGDVILLTDGIAPLSDLFRAARETRRRIYTSLIWAFAYNAVGLTLACMGILSPAYAAIAMIGSSLIIIWNSTRGGSLWLRDEHQLTEEDPPTRSTNLTA